MERYQIIYGGILLILSYIFLYNYSLTNQKTNHIFLPYIGFNELQYHKLVVIPNDAIKNGAFVRVFYNLSDGFSKTDRIGLYCLMKNGEWKILEKYSVKASKNLDFVTAKVQLCYTRSQCMFKYLKAITKNEFLPIASSDTLRFYPGLEYEPSQIHMSLTTKKDQMRIMWTSGSESTPCVKYWISNGSIRQSCGTSRTYHADDMCEPPATTVGYIDPGYLHDVLISELVENTTYFYDVGDSRKYSSEVRSFRTEQLFSSNKFRFSLAVFGDLGWDYRQGSLRTIKAISKLFNNQNPPSMILHIGDISYARGYAYRWEVFGFNIQKLASRIPYMVSIGNHEHLFINGGKNDPSKENRTIFRKKVRNDSGGECSVPMVNRFHMPENGNQLFWYSFDYGSAHIIMLSSELPLSIGSRQHSWLLWDLENVNRSLTSWLLVTMHRPMYSSLMFPKSYIVELLKKYIEPLLIKYKVDIFFAGHMHVYERTCIINGGNCVLENNLKNTWGTLHITVGSAGKLQSKKKVPSSFSTKLIYTNGFGNLEIINSSHAEWKFISSADNKILDQILLVRDH